LSGAAGDAPVCVGRALRSAESLGHGFPISAIVHDTPLEPLGALALPGSYTVKLTADGKSYAQPLILAMDPRVKSSPAGISEAIRDATTGGRAELNESFEALAQVQSARTQAEALVWKKVLVGRTESKAGGV